MKTLACVMALSLMIGYCGRAAAAEAKGDGGKQPPADRPAMVSLSNGLFQYAPPPEPWELQSVTNDGKSAIYRLPAGGTILVRFVGGGAPRQMNRADEYRKELLTQLKLLYQQKDQRANEPVEFVQELTEEKDDRFFLIASVKFRKGGNTQASWHFYRNLPPHQLMVQVLTLADDEEQVKQAKEAAVKLTAEASLVPKAQKAPPPPDTKSIIKLETALDGKPAAPAGDDQDVPEVAEAKKALAEAEGKVETELMKKKEYAAAKKKADDAEVKLKEARAKQPPGRQAIAQASYNWLEAKKPVEKMRKEAMDKDAAVAEAKKKLAEARKAAKP